MQISLVLDKVPDDPKITYISNNIESPVGHPARLFCEAFVGKQIYYSCSNQWILLIIVKLGMFTAPLKLMFRILYQIYTNPKLITKVRKQKYVRGQTNPSLGFIHCSVCNFKYFVRLIRLLINKNRNVRRTILVYVFQKLKTYIFDLPRKLQMINQH